MPVMRYRGQQKAASAETNGRALRAADLGRSAESGESLRMVMNATARTSQVEEQLAAIMAVSRAVSDGRALSDTLRQISETAAKLVNATAAAIILRRAETSAGLSVVASAGMTDRFADWLNHRTPIELGYGPTGLAAKERRPIPVEDVFTDPIFEPWRRLAVEEGFLALICVPLMVGTNRRVIGVLNVYRDFKGAWNHEEIGLLSTLADHAANAIRTAQLLDESRSQVRGLQLVVRSLRTQSHEHSNLVHALYGLLTLGEVEEARELISSADARYAAADLAVSETIANTVIAGFLHTEVVFAGNSNIQLKIDPASKIHDLPASLSELDAITILGNLIENASEAITASGATEISDRQIGLLIADRGEELLIRVRDSGPGISAPDMAAIFTPGFTTKTEHVGIGLAMVKSIISRVGADIEVQNCDGGGAAVTVRVPY